MITDFRALCIELADIITAHANPDDCAVGYVAGVLTRARAALADEPAAGEPVSFTGRFTFPADGEVAELVAKLRKLCSDLDYDDRGEEAGYCYRAAELLQRLSPPQPVQVAERLPGPEDCAPWPGEPNAGRWCWMASCVDNGWAWEQRTLGFLASFPQDFTHWLPAHALPLPEVSE